MKSLTTSVVSLVLVACAGVPRVPPTLTPVLDPCTAESVPAYLDNLESVAIRFDDAAKLADSTPRAQLAERIADLQEIRRDALAIETDRCTEYAHFYLIQYMDGIIEGFIAFLADESYESKFSAAFSKLEQYEKELDRITKRIRTPIPHQNRNLRPSDAHSGHAVKGGGKVGNF